MIGKQTFGLPKLTNFGQPEFRMRIRDSSRSRHRKLYITRRKPCELGRRPASLVLDCFGATNMARIELSPRRTRRGRAQENRTLPSNVRWLDCRSDRRSTGVG